MTIFHVRTQLNARKGSQWYKDRSERTVTTFCGASVTEYDAAWADRNRVEPWGDYVACPDCLRAVEGTQ